MNEYKNLSIKNWAVDDRPREKLIKNGVRNLSTAELIAILLGSGTKEMTAVDLAKFLLSKANNKLKELSRYTFDQLIVFKGIGEAKAISIIAALEIARRMNEESGNEKIKITSSKDVYEFIRPVIENLPHEEFWAIFLNQANKIIERVKISHGGIAGTVTDIRILYKTALEKLACSVIVCHNHPSGNIEPSNADKELTRKLYEAGNIIDVKLLDHLIIGENRYFSFADEGMIKR
jgi:DNA repair protein RadC